MNFPELFINHKYDLYSWKLIQLCAIRLGDVANV